MGSAVFSYVRGKAATRLIADMTSARGYVESWCSELPHSTAARWASLFFSLHVLTLLVSITATQVFLAAATVAYLTHLLRLQLVARASRPLWRERPAPARGQDACGTAGETPALPAISFPPIKLPLLLFCLTTLNSTLWAQNPAGGWVAVRKLVLFLILLLSVNLVASARHLAALFRGVFLVSALAALVGTAQFVIQYHSLRHLPYDRVYYYMTLTRIHGFMGHWMNFGGQQMLVFTALLAFLLLCHGVTSSPPQREEGLGGGGCRNQHFANHPLAPSSSRRGIIRSTAKGLYWLVLVLIATSLVLNFTRGVWLGCVVAALYIVARWKPRTLWVIPVLIVVAYLAAPSMLRRRVSLAFHPTNDPALAIRLEMWGAGLKMVREHPWVGVGSIRQVYTQYLPPGSTPMAGYHDHLHDNFLQLAAERGLPCLVAWLWFMLALGWSILRIRGRLYSQRWIADAAFAAWLAFIAEGFFEYNFGTSPVLMVFLFVMSTPFVAENIERRRQESISPR